MRCTLGRVFTLILCGIAITLLVALASTFHSSFPVHKKLGELLPPAKAPREYRPLQRGLPTLNQTTIDGVRTFLFFVGYPRSGHSIVASCLDAHPDAIVAHEFNLFAKLLMPQVAAQIKNRTVLYSALYQNSFRQSLLGWRSGQDLYRGQKGYTLQVNSTNSWQGKFRRLTVIGDKSGGVTSHTYRDAPGQFMAAYKELSELVRVPIKVIHVVRNPFDIVATKLLYRLSETKGKKGDYSLGSPITNVRHVMQAIKAVESEANSVNSLLKELDALEVHSEDFILNTKNTVKQMCDFLGLDCPDSYLQICDKATYDQPSRSRSVVTWTKASQWYVEELIAKFPFFSKYTLDS